MEIFETDTWESVAFRGFDGIPFGFNPRFADDGRLFLLRSFEPTLVLSADTFDLVAELDATGIGDISSNGSRIFGFYTAHGFNGVAGTQWSVLSFNSDDGALTDILYDEVGFPGIPFGATATDDGLLIVSGRATTLIYDIKTGEEKLSLPTGEVASLGYDGERRVLYTSGSAEGPRVWDLAASSIGVESTADLGAYTWINGNGFTVGPTFGAAEAIDLTDSRTQTRFFDLSTGHTVDIAPDTIPVAALANGKFVLIQQPNAEANELLYDPTTGETVVYWECTNVDEEVGCLDQGWNLVVSLDGKEMYAYPWSAEDPEILSGEILKLDPQTGSVISSEVPELKPIVIEVLTDTWALGSPTSRIDYRAFDPSTQEVFWQDELGHIRNIPAPDGNWFATYAGTNSVQLVNTSTWESREITGTLGIRGGSFNDDASLLAVGDLRNLTIIDVETGLIAQQVRLPGVSDVHWIDDEKMIVGTNNGVFGVLSVATHELVEKTRAALRRTFTGQECELYRITPCPTLEEIRSR